MEMPVDILAARLGKIRDNGDIDFDFDVSALACDIDLELQEKFIVIPQEEIDAVELENDRGQWHAGSGPEHCVAGLGENPAWLYNHAVNALALYKQLKDAELLEAEQREIERKYQENLAQRPEPGIYHLTTGRGVDPYLVAVTADRRIIDLKRTGKCTDFTDTFDTLTNKSSWTFALIETGLGA